MINNHLISRFAFICVLIGSTLTQLNTQGQSITTITEIQAPVVETSGLLRLEGKTITHNDSGGEAALYEIDTLSGQVSRQVGIGFSSNIDWEAVCMDDDHIYIGDFGNNQGTRTDLKVYKISKSEYLDENNTSVDAEIISFIYEDQDDFTPSQFTTNFDAEAFIVKDQTLYIFTKNWGNFWSNIYALPTTPGAYLANRIDSINTEGMVTDATYSEEDDRIALVGYTSGLVPFIFEIDNITAPLFSQSELTRTDLTFPSGFSRQVEGVSHIAGENYILSSEEGITGDAGLFNLSMSEPNSIEENNGADFNIYPNPTSDILYVKSDYPTQFDILNIQGKLMRSSNTDSVNLKGLPTGTYIVSIQTKEGVEIKREKIVLQ